MKVNTKVVLFAVICLTLSAFFGQPVKAVPTYYSGYAEAIWSSRHVDAVDALGGTSEEGTPATWGNWFANPLGQVTAYINYELYEGGTWPNGDLKENRWTFRITVYKKDLSDNWVLAGQDERHKHDEYGGPDNEVGMLTVTTTLDRNHQEFKINIYVRYKWSPWTYEDWDEITDSDDYFAFVHETPLVGGFWVPVDKFGLLATYIGLASTIVVATVTATIYIKRMKRRKR